MQHVIEITQLRRSFGAKEVLRGLTLNVERGKVFGFLGPNGAGKTTTMSILTGVLEASSGEVKVLGRPMAPDDEALRKRIGVVHDSQNLFENMTAVEHLIFSSAIYGVPRSQILGRCEGLLELLDLKDAANSRIHEYSHGMKKKTALACSLIHDPEVLFLDEPFEGMDAASTLAVMDNLRSLGRCGKTIFVTSHILDLVERLCDEVAIIHFGQCVYQERVHGRADADNEKPARTLEGAFLRLTSGDRQRGLLSWASSKLQHSAPEENTEDVHK